MDLRKFCPGFKHLFDIVNLSFSTKYCIMSNSINIKFIRCLDSKTGPITQKPNSETITPGMHASTGVIKGPYEFFVGKPAS